MLHALNDGSLLPPPGVAVPLAAAAAVYVRGLGRTRQRRPRAGAFIGGWAVLGLALATPLHGAGQSWLSAHMLQHMLLMSVAAPLLVWSRPTGILLRGLPARGRAELIRVMRWLRPAVSRLSGIGVACALQAVLLWLWHAPAFYTRTLTSGLVHDAQHITLLGAAVLFWASIEPALRQRSLAGLAVLSLFVTTLHTSVLAALLTFSSVVWYAPYAWSPEALSDQQLAGLIMWVPGALPYVAAALLVLWSALEEPRPRMRAAAVRSGLVPSTDELTGVRNAAPEAAPGRK
jgi:putative membrane protein